MSERAFTIQIDAPMSASAFFGHYHVSHPMICWYLTSYRSKSLALFRNIWGLFTSSFRMAGRAFTVRTASTISKSAFFRLHHVLLLISHLILIGIVSSLLQYFGEIYTSISSAKARIYDANCNRYVEKRNYQVSKTHFSLFLILSVSWNLYAGLKKVSEQVEAWLNCPFSWGSFDAGGE